MRNKLLKGLADHIIAASDADKTYGLNYGTIDNVREHISGAIKLLQKHGELEIADGIKLSTKGLIKTEVSESKGTLKFHILAPQPKVEVKRIFNFKGYIQTLFINTEELTISISGLPDAHFKIGS